MQILLSQRSNWIFVHVSPFVYVLPFTFEIEIED